MSLLIVIFHKTEPKLDVVKSVLNLPPEEGVVLAKSTALVRTQLSGKVVMDRLKKETKDEITVIPWASSGWFKTWSHEEMEKFINDAIGDDTGPRQVLMG